jgi:hypothetical protein
VPLRLFFFCCFGCGFRLAFALSFLRSHLRCLSGLLSVPPLPLLFGLCPRIILAPVVFFMGLRSSAGGLPRFAGTPGGRTEMRGCCAGWSAAPDEIDAQKNRLRCVTRRLFSAGSAAAPRGMAAKKGGCAGLLNSCSNATSAMVWRLRPARTRFRKVCVCAVPAAAPGEKAA